MMYYYNPSSILLYYLLDTHKKDIQIMRCIELLLLLLCAMKRR